MKWRSIRHLALDVVFQNVMKLHNVGVIQAFHDADFFLERVERVGCLGAEGAAAPAELRDLSEGASANFDGEESPAGVFAQFHLQWRGDAAQADTRQNAGGVARSRGHAGMKNRGCGL